MNSDSTDDGLQPSDAKNLVTYLLVRIAVTLIVMIVVLWFVVREVARRHTPVYSQAIEYSSDCAISPEGDEVSTMRDNLRFTRSHDNAPVVQSWRLPLGNAPKPIREIKDAQFLSYSPDGQLMAIGRPVEIRVIDRRSRTERFLFPFPNDWIGSAIFSPDGRWLALDQSSSINLDFRLVNLIDGSSTTIDTRWSFSSIHFLTNPDVVLVTRSNGSWEKWSIAEMRAISSVSAPEEDVQCVALSSDCKLLALLMASGRTYVWDVDREMHLARFPAFPAQKTSEYVALCFATDNSMLIGARETDCRRFDPQNGSFLGGWFYEHVATEFKVWNVGDWNCIQTWLAVDHYCVQIRSIPGTRQFLSLDPDELQVWNLPPSTASKD